MNLFDIANIKANQSDINLSHIYEVDEGGFGAENRGIRTYFCSATVSKIKDDIETFEKLTEDKAWPVSQIIQREVDRERIKRIATQYILRDMNLKYFPPVIIAILPRDEESGIAQSFELKSQINDDEREIIYKKSKFSNNSDAFPLFQKAANKSAIAGFYVLDILPDFRYKVLCWDKQKYYAVVIDGQHRLEALKESAKKKIDVNNYLQDIVFIDLSEKAKNKDISPVEAVRRIFIDINYSAVPVTPARKCLMDDKDLASLFVQALVNDDDPNGKRKGKYLLPQLVDWYSENLKHQLPHLTGVLVLYQLMSDVVLNRVNLEKIKDLQSSTKVRKWISRLQGRFLVDEQIKELSEYERVEPLHKSQEKYEKEIEKEKGEVDTEELLLLFEYDYRVLEIAQKVFIEVYCKSIIRFFNELYHYKKAIDLLATKNAFDKKFKLNKLLVRSPKKYTKDDKQFIKETEEYLRNELESTFYILYTVLGQKTMFEIFFKQIEKEIGNDISENAVDRAALKFLTQFNKILKIIGSYSGKYKLFGDKKHNNSIPVPIQRKYSIIQYGNQGSNFWEDIIYKDNSIIYNRQGIGALRSILEYIYCFFEINDFGEIEEVVYPEKELFKVNYTKSRIKRRLEYEQNVENAEINETVANSIMEAKREFMNEYFKDAILDWKKEK